MIWEFDVRGKLYVEAKDEDEAIRKLCDHDYWMDDTIYSPPIPHENVDDISS